MFVFVIVLRLQMVDGVKWFSQYWGGYMYHMSYHFNLKDKLKSTGRKVVKCHSVFDVEKTVDEDHRL